MSETNDKGAAWIVAGLLLMAGALGMAVAMFILHTAHETPWWLVALLCALVLSSVWCFGMAEEAWHAERDSLEADPPEFGPGKYVGPERRLSERHHPAPHLRVVDVEGAQRRCGQPPRVDETV